jgi:acetyl-CoA synthetase/medium-chain acyl-CoA synthetase
MVQEKDPALFKFKAIRNCFGSGEAVNPEVSKQWELKTGFPIHEFYGQTETTAMGAPPTQAKKPGSIGKCVTYDLRIVDDEGKEVGANTEGNIATPYKPKRPVGLFKGYMRPGPNGLEVNDQVDCYRGDYYLLGDRGYLDEEGYLFFVGRADDVISSAGYRIGPYEVESVLLTHEAVAESAVVGVPDEKRGEVVKAFIVRTEKYRDADEEELIKDIQDFVKENTAPYKYPRKIQFLDSLPKTISGKILRRQLRQLR